MTTNRFSLIIAVSVIAALALLTVSMVPSSHNARPANETSAQQAYLAQRQGEWTAGVTAEQAYMEQRQGEQNAGAAISAQQAYMAYREGEWNAGHLYDAAQAYLNYRRGEWTGK